MQIITEIRENSTPQSIKRESNTHPYTEHGWVYAGQFTVGCPIYQQAGFTLVETPHGWIVQNPTGHQFYYSECTLQQLTTDLLKGQLQNDTLTFQPVQEMPGLQKQQS